MKEDLKLISLSGGRTSGYMTLKLMEDKTIADKAVVIFCNTGKEVEPTLKFVNDIDLYLQKHYQISVIWLEYDNSETGYKEVSFKTASRNGEPFSKLINKRGFPPNVMARYCTQELKIRVIRKYLRQLGYKSWDAYLGIRYDEPRRYSKQKNSDTGNCWETIYPLVQWKVTKSDVLKFWNSFEFNLSFESLPGGNLDDFWGNCDLCFLKGKHKKILLLRSDPKIGEWWNDEEIKTGGYFETNIHTNIY